ncbi:MAG: 30S ribosomal protein S16 [Actinobacteria bacterium]|nr:30S ribosomal protein S16 [Actinomycetota bacterium]
MIPPVFCLGSSSAPPSGLWPIGVVRLVVAADTKKARNGEFLEIVGTYRPLENPSGFAVDNAKVLQWLNKGALPTERVRKLLETTGLWGEFMATKSSKKK